MRVGILIAVRMKSQRLPKKALAMIEDQTIIEHLIDRVKLAKKVDDVILCTSTHPDDEVLTKIAEKKGIKWFRGEEDDVLKRFIDCAKKEKLDIVVRVTGDNPLTDPKIIDKLIESHINNHAGYTTMDNLPLGITVEVASLSTLKRAHQLATNPENTEYMTNYLRDSKHFKLNILQAKGVFKRPQYRLTVDTSDDLELMREVYKVLYKKKKIIKLESVIHLLDNNPKLAKINTEIKQREYENHKNRP